MKRLAELAPVSWQRMIRGVEKVRDRLLRAARALDAAGVPYAVRDKDRTHLRDLIDVQLIDDSWLDRLEPELRRRLKSLLDTPEG